MHKPAKAIAKAASGPCVTLPRRTGTLLAAALLAAGLPLGVAQGENAGASVRSPAPTCNRAAFRIALDVGHTAEHPGALSAHGVTEYDFNLRLARVIERALMDAGFRRTVLLVTAGETMPGLARRVARANTMPADLFLSIHHDSVPDALIERWQEDDKARRFSDRFKGHSLFISHDNPQREASLRFGRLLGRQMKARGLLYTPHYTENFMGSRKRELLDATAGVYRYDKLIVLRATRMPAVLLEAGMIVNREEEILLASAEHQATIAAAVADAVDQFCAARTSRIPALIASQAKQPDARKTVRPAGTARGPDRTKPN